MKRKSEPEKVTRPGMSDRLRLFAKTLRTLRSVSTIAAIPIGTLTKKIHSQPRLLGDHAADQRADRDRAADRRPPDPERRRPVFALELLADQGQ